MPRKNEMRKKIKRDVRRSLVAGVRVAGDETETERKIKIIFPSHIYEQQHTQQISSVCCLFGKPSYRPASICSALQLKKCNSFTRMVHSSGLHKALVLHMYVFIKVVC